MSAYWIAHVTVHEPEEYKKYQDIAKEVFANYQAKFIVRSESSENLEGPQYTRHVIIQFKNMDVALQCYHSPEYQKAKKHRENASNTMITIVPQL